MWVSACQRSSTDYAYMTMDWRAGGMDFPNTAGSHPVTARRVSPVRGRPGRFAGRGAAK
ncbi:protein of unknown function [Streptantibioticus cattleyicolor NRRL 8057 = DSM 46488]|nr:protein of unknown function [Streptantibioticus cattleyicolor NRRL 8057 = DSM 46488]